MLQRVQTIYLILVIICLGIGVSTDIGYYSLSEKDVEFSAVVNAKGVSFQLAVDGEVKNIEEIIHEVQSRGPNPLLSKKTIAVLEKGGKEYPLYIPYLVILCLTIWVIVSYKNLKRQLSFARINTFLSFFLCMGVIIGFSMGKSIGIDMMGMKGVDDIEIGTGMGVGFFLTIASFPFALLAQLAIKRDLKLIQSIDRIR